MTCNPIKVNNFNTSKTSIPIKIEGGSSQNLILFISWSAIPGASIIIGVSQFSNPAIMNGIFIKNYN